MPVTVVIDNKGAYSDHAVYFVACAGRDEAEALARLVEAFQRCQVEAVGQLDWRRGKPARAQEPDPQRRWWADEAFGGDWSAEQVVASAWALDVDDYDDYDVRGLPHRVTLDDLRRFPHIRMLSLLADSIEAHATGTAAGTGPPEPA